MTTPLKDRLSNFIDVTFRHVTAWRERGERERGRERERERERGGEREKEREREGERESKDIHESTK